MYFEWLPVTILWHLSNCIMSNVFIIKLNKCVKAKPNRRNRITNETHNKRPPSQHRYEMPNEMLNKWFSAFSQRNIRYVSQRVAILYVEEFHRKSKMVWFFFEFHLFLGKLVQKSYIYFPRKLFHLEVMNGNDEKFVTVIYGFFCRIYNHRRWCFICLSFSVFSKTLR